MKNIQALAGLLAKFFAISLLFVSSVSFANIDVRFVDSMDDSKNTLVLVVNEPGALTGYSKTLNESTEQNFSALLSLNNFTGKFGEVQTLQLIGGFEHVVVVGTQNDLPLTAPELQNLGGKIAATLSSKNKDIEAIILTDNLNAELDDAAAQIAFGYHLRHYSFDKYKASKADGKSSLTFVVNNVSLNQNAYENDLRFLAEGVHFTRDLASEPGMSLYPQAFVERVKEKFKGIDNINIDVLDVRDMEKNNMGALLGVGKGSIHDPRLLVIEYTGAKKGEAPIALAGKGITFDTGGISLKGNDNMWQMKSDMSGAAAVAGTLYAIAQRGEKVNVVGLMPLAENMPAEDAIRPGDVLNTMQGTTIEIMSTDAEGRLILSDAVYYAQQKYKPKMLLNIATLTGSAARALSDEYAALITRDFAFSQQIMQIGEKSGELVWPLPLHPNHFEQIKSDIADIKNSGAGNPGASIGAAVIATFVDEDLPWVHLDIAGVDWLSADIDVAPKGSQGWGVRFMDELVRQNKP
uniref:leucyl aminopeptidase n=1 Tax=Ningiella ruwaisensis TaxID=2364274 RepID=UPI00109FCF73|nr:leucyl aminopeptidase [Ningiella ruwaisensis]